jgi:hypothetical protein
MAFQTAPLFLEATIVLGATGVASDPLTVNASTAPSPPATKQIALMPGAPFLLTAAWYTAIAGLDNMPSMTQLDVQVVPDTSQALVQVIASAKPGASGSITIRIMALNQTTAE